MEIPSSLTFRTLGIICLISSILTSTSALSFAETAAQVFGVLQQRDSSCGNDTYQTCSPVDSALPNNFCCPQETACVSLDSSSSALCCPSGADCSVIQPIECSVGLQNLTLNPNAVIMTTKLGDGLPGCNGKCCPFGYACGVALNGDAICRIDRETSSLSRGSTNSTTTTSTLVLSSTSSSSSLPTSPATTTTKSASSTSTATSPTSSGEGIDSTQPISSSKCAKFPGGAVAAGFFGGLIGGILLALAGVLCLGKRHPDRTSKVSSKLSSHFRGRSADGTIIGVSDPIPQSQSARTEFLRRQPERLKRTGTRVKSWFNAKGIPFSDQGRGLTDEGNWKMPTPPEPNNIPLAPVGRTLPFTPERRIPKAHMTTTLAKPPSTESIRVYTPQNMTSPASEGLQQTPAGAAYGASRMSPFKTPDKTSYAMRSRVEDENNEGILNPSTYESSPNTGGQNKSKKGPSRPTTTFTDMLHGIGFPDSAPPAMPEVPRALKPKKGTRS